MSALINCEPGVASELIEKVIYELIRDMSENSASLEIAFTKYFYKIFCRSTGQFSFFYDDGEFSIGCTDACEIFTEKSFKAPLFSIKNNTKSFDTEDIKWRYYEKENEKSSDFYISLKCVDAHRRRILYLKIKDACGRSQEYLKDLTLNTSALTKLIFYFRHLMQKEINNAISLEYINLVNNNKIKKKDKCTIIDELFNFHLLIDNYLFESEFRDKLRLGCFYQIIQSIMNEFYLENTELVLSDEIVITIDKYLDRTFSIDVKSIISLQGQIETINANYHNAVDCFVSWGSILYLLVTNRMEHANTNLFDSAKTSLDNLIHKVLDKELTLSRNLLLLNYINNCTPICDVSSFTISNAYCVVESCSEILYSENEIEHQSNSKNLLNCFTKVINFNIVKNINFRIPASLLKLIDFTLKKDNFEENENQLISEYKQHFLDTLIFGNLIYYQKTTNKHHELIDLLSLQGNIYHTEKLSSNKQSNYNKRRFEIIFYFLTLFNDVALKTDIKLELNDKPHLDIINDFHKHKIIKDSEKQQLLDLHDDKIHNIALFSSWIVHNEIIKFNRPSAKYQYDEKLCKEIIRGILYLSFAPKTFDIDEENPAIALFIFCNAIYNWNPSRYKYNVYHNSNAIWPAHLPYAVSILNFIKPTDPVGPVIQLEINQSPSDININRKSAYLLLHLVQTLGRLIGNDYWQPEIRFKLHDKDKIISGLKSMAEETNYQDLGMLILEWLEEHNNDSGIEDCNTWQIKCGRQWFDNHDVNLLIMEFENE